VAYFSPKIEIKNAVRAALDEALPTWEANYEPGNVSDYLISYANDEIAAKGAAIAWLTSQSDKDPATLEWVEMPTGDQHDHWYDLIQNHDDGIPTDTGINVRHRLPAGIRDAARQASGQQPDSAAAHCCGNCDGIDPATCLANPDRAASTPDPTIADDPTPLRWGLGDVLHGDDDTVIVCMSGPDREPYWLELDPERAAALRDDLADPHAPAAGLSDTQPANDRATVLDEAIKAVLGRVQAYEGMGQEAIALNRERSAIAEKLRRMADEETSR
jgi:hypothetical protein